MHIYIKHKYLNLCNNKITNNKNIQEEYKGKNEEQELKRNIKKFRLLLLFSVLKSKSIEVHQPCS